MKRNISTFLLFLALGAASVQAQGEEPAAEAGGRRLPDVTIQNLEGQKLSAATIQNDGKPIVVSFWATWCKPCVQELMAIQEHYEEWQEETGMKLVAISIDDARNAAKVGPFVNGRAWEYEVYIDSNQDLKRGLGVLNVPHTFVIGPTGEIVWDHNSYSPGDEEHLHEVLQKVAKGEKLD